MNFAQIIKYSFLKTFRDKRNIFYIILLFICSVIIFGALTFQKTYSNMLDNEYKKNISYRTLIVRPNNDDLDNYFENHNRDYIKGYQKILDIPEVDGYYMQKYEAYYAHDTSFKRGKYESSVSLLYGTEFTIPKLSRGEIFSENDTGVAICDENFYPYSSSSIKEMMKVDKSKYITGDKLLGSTFTIYDNELAKDAADEDKAYVVGPYEKAFTIVGTFKRPSNDSAAHSACYISPRDSEELYNKIYKAGGEKSYSFSDYILVVVNKYENLNKVGKTISDMGFNVITKIVFDHYTENIIEIVTIALTFVSTIGVFIIIYLYTKKRVINDTSNIGLLKTLGYKNKDIILINVFTVTSLSIFSIIMGVLFVEAVIFVLKLRFTNLLLYLSIDIIRSISPFIISIVIFIIIPVLVSYIMMIRLLKKNTITLIRSEKQ